MWNNDEKLGFFSEALPFYHRNKNSWRTFLFETSVNDQRGINIHRELLYIFCMVSSTAHLSLSSGFRLKWKELFLPYISSRENQSGFVRKIYCRRLKMMSLSSAQPKQRKNILIPKEILLFDVNNAFVYHIPRTQISNNSLFACTTLKSTNQSLL